MKLSTLVTSLLLVVSFSAQSAIRKLDLELYPQGIPGAIDTSNEGKLFDERFNDRFITAISKPSLTLYLPENKSVEKTVIICPGGGYFGVSSIKEGQEVAERFAENGVAAAVLWYRMPNTANMEVPLRQAAGFRRLANHIHVDDPEVCATAGLAIEREVAVQLLPCLVLFRFWLGHAQRHLATRGRPGVARHTSLDTREHECLPSGRRDQVDLIPVAPVGGEGEPATVRRPRR